MQNLESKLNQINNALSSALSSINLAKNLLKDIQGTGTAKDMGQSVPGTFGKFMGDVMVTPDGKKYEVSSNYAAKSMLVYGDTLKLQEENGEKRFKQVERIKRLRVEGILAKKEGRWHAVTADGSYRVLDTAVEFLSGKEGSQVVALIPQENKYAPYAALESVDGVTMESKRTPPHPVQSPEIKVSTTSVVSSASIENKPADVSEPKVTPQEVHAPKEEKKPDLRPDIRREPKRTDGPQGGRSRGDNRGERSSGSRSEGGPRSGGGQRPDNGPRPDSGPRPARKPIENKGSFMKKPVPEPQTVVTEKPNTEAAPTITLTDEDLR